MIQARCVTTSVNPIYFPCDPQFEADGVAAWMLAGAVFLAAVILTIKAVVNR